MDRIIGIVGGLGPKAGEHLHGRILANTRAVKDQDHLRILLYTNPSIPDRSEYLEGKTHQNPGQPILESLMLLVKMGATVLCVPCNTAHAPPIWDYVTAGLQRAAPEAELLHIVEITVAHLLQHHPSVSHVGILSTAATRDSGVYQAALGRHNIRALFPTETNQRHVQEAIFHPDWGIKAQSAPVTQQAMDSLEAAAVRMIADGAEAIILGCTEIPLAVRGQTIKGIPVIDSTACLARQAIRCAASDAKLVSQPR